MQRAARSGEPRPCFARWRDDEHRTRYLFYLWSRSGTKMARSIHGGTARAFRVGHRCAMGRQADGLAPEARVRTGGEGR